MNRVESFLDHGALAALIVVFLALLLVIGGGLASAVIRCKDSASSTAHITCDPGARVSIEGERYVCRCAP